jgi:hypothetical protein
METNTYTDRWPPVLRMNARLAATVDHEPTTRRPGSGADRRRIEPPTPGFSVPSSVVRSRAEVATRIPTDGRCEAIAGRMPPQRTRWKWVVR